MPIASNTHRPHIGILADNRPLAHDAIPADRDEAIRNLIALAPEDERADLEALLLSDSSESDRVHKPSIPAQDAAVDRLCDLARAGRMDKFAELAFGLPNLHRVEAPVSNARHRPATAQDSYTRALASGERAAAADEAAKLFPNMNRI